MKVDGQEIILFENVHIQKCVIDTIQELHSEFELDEECIFVCVLNGAFMFFTDLVKKLPRTVLLDFVQISSYQNTTQPGEIKVIKDISQNYEGKRVFIIDDILDSGKTIGYLAKRLKSAGAIEVHSITVLERKVSTTPVGIHSHRALFTIDDEFVYGYGMDLFGKYRNINKICYIEQNVD